MQFPTSSAVGQARETPLCSATTLIIRAPVLGRDRIEMCYNHSGLSPSGSIVGTSFVMARAKN
jgi:hypothetical protein